MSNDSSLTRRQIVYRIGAIAGVVVFSILILLNANKLAVLGNYGYAGVFVLSFLANATIILPAPGWLIPIAAGTTLNPLLVGIMAGTGQALGELTGYIAGASGSIAIEDRERYNRLHELANRYGLWIYLVLGFVPNPIFDLAGITAGALKVPVLSFLFATWVGKTARAILLAYGGYRILGQLLGL